jgi:ATP-dependent DNA helicase RecG
MNRLLQGDVGSGKTIVALLHAQRHPERLPSCAHGSDWKSSQSSTHHGIQLTRWRPRRSCGEPESERREKSRASRRIGAHSHSGEAQIIIGTHAVFEGRCAVRQAGLIIIDEQHRFGVAQRQRLQQHGRASHADGTRTPHATRDERHAHPAEHVSMTLYGDLDVSAIDQSPSNSQTHPHQCLSPIPLWKLCSI